MTDRKEYMKNYNKSPTGKKNHTINNWKSRGLKETNEFIEQIYDEYLRSEECELCGEPYSKHNQWKADRAGKNITWDKDSNKHKVRIKRNYKNVLQKRCKTEQECREILDKFMIDNPHYFT